MTSWKPAVDRGDAPRYVAIAEAIARDVKSGRLAAGARLPTHRDLARTLGVTVGTVTRGYEEARRRGLVSGEVGRGTFVRAPRPEPLSFGPPERDEAAIADFAFNLPPLAAAEAPTGRHSLPWRRRKAWKDSSSTSPTPVRAPTGKRVRGGSGNSGWTRERTTS